VKHLKGKKFRRSRLMHLKRSRFTLLNVRTVKPKYALVIKDAQNAIKKIASMSKTIHLMMSINKR
jgi:hypothetical protein